MNNERTGIHGRSDGRAGHGQSGQMPFDHVGNEARSVHRGEDDLVADVGGLLTDDGREVAVE